MIEVHIGHETVHYNKDVTTLFTDFIRHFEELERAFPLPQYDGSMDFVCVC